MNSSNQSDLATDHGPGAPGRGVALLCGALLWLALLLLAAHFLRRYGFGTAALWLLLPPLILLRRAWLRPVLQGALLLGIFHWCRSGLVLVQLRLAFDEPWLRLALILGAVLAVLVGALLALWGNAARAWFNGQADRAWPQAWACALTLLLLLVARDKAPFAILLADRFAPGWGVFQAGLHALYAAWLAGALLDPARHRRLRPWLWGGFSVVFFGQLALGLAGVERLLMTGQLHLPVPALMLGGPLYRGHGFFMPILFGVTLLLVGPAWCSHLCYIGAWDDGASRLEGRKPQQPTRTPWRGRLLTLLLTVLLALGLRLAGVGTLWALLVAGGFGLLGVGVMLYWSRRSGRMVHCTAWCPMGLVSNVLGRLTPWRMRMAEGCTRCGACSRVCRYGALRPLDLEQGRPGLSCTLCGDCSAVCAHQVLHYSFWGLGRDTSRALFVVLVTALHAGFLAVARI